MKNLLEISSFYTFVPKATIIWSMIPEIWINRDIIFFNLVVILGHFSPFTLLTAWKSKFQKIEKENTWRCHHFTHLYHKWQSYNVYFLRYGARQTDFFVILGIFAHLPTNKPKNQNFYKNKKMHTDTIILHMCNKNYDHVMYIS